MLTAFWLLVLCLTTTSGANPARLDPVLHLTPAPCPCFDARLCQPVALTRRREVFGFSSSRDWRVLDWDVVTTIAWEPSDPELLCHAHAHGVRLIAAAPPTLLTDNVTARREWALAAAGMVRSQHLDGITFDYEGGMAPNSPERAQYVALVAATATVLRRLDPHYQISVCVPWSPHDIDGRSYDWVGLADASDLLYIMAYDLRSQIFDRCLASANSALPAVRMGLEQYLRLGLNPDKLVLGVPWYGYDYSCEGPLDPDTLYCPLSRYPFLGVNCSDGIGGQVPYSAIMARLDAGNTTTGRRYDQYLQSPFYNYLAADGRLHQLWYDDPESLSAKYRFARELKLRGVGPFTFDYLDATGEKTRNPSGHRETRAMWDAIRADFLA